tara:strand:+ start:3959 stop:4156 length:198 start_codon:yes stop_codon:yes gene_type:complete
MKKYVVVNNLNRRVLTIPRTGATITQAEYDKLKKSDFFNKQVEIKHLEVSEYKEPVKKKKETSEK